MAFAKPVSIPIAKVGENELNAVLPSEKLLLLLLLANAVHIIWALVKGIWDSKEKRADKTSEKIEDLHKMVHEIESQINTVLATMPRESAIMERVRAEMELIAFKTFRRMDKDK